MPEQPVPYEPSLRDYWDILSRRRWIVISFCVICTTVVVATSFLMTPLFRATTAVVVQGEAADVLGQDDAGTQGISFDIYENYLETQMQIILSRDIAGKVFDELKLVELDRYSKRIDPMKTFLADIYLERTKGTRLIKISVENPSPELSARIANRLAEVYSESNTMRRAMSFIRNQRMATLNMEFMRLQAEYDALSNQYGPKHPAMVMLSEKIKNASQRIEGARSGQPVVGADGAVVNPDLQLQDLLTQIQENSVLSSTRMKNVYISERAVVPVKKAKPQRILYSAVGFAGSLLVGIFLAFLVEYLDDSIKTEEDFKKFAPKAHLLGSVFNEKGRHKKNSEKAKIDKLVHLQSESPSAEVYRLIRMGIVMYGRANPLHDFAVTSPGPGEGKTTVTTNLAIAMAQLQKKVLLVDSDFRKGRIHDTFYLDNERGLAHYLMEEMTFKDIVRETDVPDLHVVTCGATRMNTSWLFTSPRMGAFIQEARKQFDLVIYDTAPFLIISDSLAFISQLDGVVLNIRGGMTGGRTLERAVAKLQESGAKIVGATLNATAPPLASSYHKYYRR